MFEVIPQPEFEAWYEQLPEALAEEVTAAIDLAASVGGLAAPERLSRLLLWFDGGEATGVSASSARLDPLAHGAAPGSLARSYLEWHHEVVLCLGSPVLQERLARLAGPRAAQVLREVERLKRRLHFQRMSSNYAPWSVGRAGLGAENLRRSFVELLSLLGLDPELTLGSGSGLRELRIDGVSPALRVLFGLDFPRRRLIAILGESLDRRYYGDAVRRAEQSFQRYCDEQASGVGATAP